MKRKSVIITVMLLFCGSLWASPATEQEARMVVEGWLRMDSQPMNAVLGREVAGVEAFTDDDGEPVYYIVSLEPAGFVIVSADDLVEPIIGFVNKGTFDSSLGNPLAALVTRDLGGRVKTARGRLRPLSADRSATATDSQEKWRTLKNLASRPEGEIRLMGLSSVSDVRVEPLVQSKWSQDYVYSSSSYSFRLCYNYYTPRNYYCGCVATAMAQLMRYHRYPTTGITSRQFSIVVDGIQRQASTLGGDGSGGPYNWDDMVLNPDYYTPDKNRRAIGALCYDAGLSVNMVYSFSGSCPQEPLCVSNALVNTFGYANAIACYTGSSSIGPGMIGMINPNLDAEMPVILGIAGDEGAHAVVCDGYGYDTSTMYHHLNMGWNGLDDAWYNLPDTQGSEEEYNSVDGCFYNIFKTETGEIISGRVTGPAGNPLDGCVVTAQHTDGTIYTATTNAKGIYALVGVASDSTYTVSVTGPGCDFAPRTVITSKSEDFVTLSGNRWPVDFPHIQPASVLYVNQGVTSGANDGSSWADAFTDLQDALKIAVRYPDDVNEIWVARGTYNPDRDWGFRPSSFHLINTVGIYGGFAGNETQRQQRDPQTN